MWFSYNTHVYLNCAGKELNENYSSFKLRSQRAYKPRINHCSRRDQTRGNQSTTWFRALRTPPPNERKKSKKQINSLHLRNSVTSSSLSFSLSYLLLSPPTDCEPLYIYIYISSSCCDDVIYIYRYRKKYSRIVECVPRICHRASGYWGRRKSAESREGGGDDDERRTLPLKSLLLRFFLSFAKPRARARIQREHVL